ncbi:MAG TPA: MFS transporter [Nocardioidaceae bacterium]|nr:MFS transporter [Nocardioidaceae bacterium]
MVKAATQDKVPITRAEGLGLVAMGLAVLVIANDFTALSIAIPAIEQDLDSDVTTTQWVINGYALVFGILIVTGGRLADMFGRRRIFFIGSAIFAVFSVLAGLADDVWLLLLARAVMGVGGALMWPAILGMTFAIVPRNRAGIAGGLILGMAGFGNAVGPLLGGVLTDLASWRWIFFLNLPIAAFAAFVTWRVVPATRPEDAERRLDYGGIVALSVALLALLLALDLGADEGWTDPIIVGLFAVAAVGVVLFGLIERSVGDRALVPKDVIQNQAFFTAGLATLLMSAIFFAALLYLPQFMTKELGFSPLKAGVGLLPMMGLFALASFVSGPLYSRVGPKLIVSAGAICLASGIFMLSWVDTIDSYQGLVIGMIVVGAGIGLFLSSITTVAITALDESRASLGGAIVYMFQIAGGAVGLGLNTALVVTASSLPDGIHTAFLVDTALALCGLAVVILFVGGRVDEERIRNLRHHHRAHA